MSKRKKSAGKSVSKAAAELSGVSKEPNPAAAMKRSAAENHKSYLSQPHRPKEKKHAVLQQYGKDKVLSNPCDADVALSRGLINTLFMLTNAPVFPDIPSQMTKVESRTEGISITVDDEKHLVDSFVFIASTSTDSSLVKAICLSWNPDIGGGAYILQVAANHGDLCPLKESLERVISSLGSSETDTKKALPINPSASRVDWADKRFLTVLRIIVSINFNRILCRLQSKHAKWDSLRRMAKKRKGSTPALLVKAYRSHQGTERSQLISSLIEELNNAFAEVEKSIFSVSSSPPNMTVDKLIEVIRILHQISSTNSPPRKWVSNQAVLRKVDKICQYADVVTVLQSLGVNHIWLRSLVVEIVKICPGPRAPFENRSNCFKNFLSSQGFPKSVINSVVSKVRKVAYRPQGDNDKLFVDLMDSRCPIHAEIQLLLHNEKHIEDRLPRYIASTKNPCFLCALFFQVHGRYQIPKSHGRLYEKWTLPNLEMGELSRASPKLQHTMEAFQHALSKCIKDYAANNAHGACASSESFVADFMAYLKASIAARIPSPILESSSSRYSASRSSYRSSTSMLIDKIIRTVKLARGRSIVFQLSQSSTKPHVIEVPRMKLHFWPDERQIKCRNVANSVRYGLWSMAGVSLSEIAIEDASSSIMDLTLLKQGEEVSMDISRAEKGFRVKYKGEVLRMQRYG